MFRHLDLFSGIGCWALAGREAFGTQHEMVGFCEIDPFCRAVLSKHYPDVPIYGDIKTLADTEGWPSGEPKTRNGRKNPSRRNNETFDLTLADAGCELRQSTAGKKPETTTAKRNQGSAQHKRSSQYGLDLLTASPPCQAASSAGRRKGTKDDRWLWPATFAVITRTRPRWVVLENVRGLLSLEGGLVFDDLLLGMEKDGYEVWPFVAPAAGVGAPHQRARVWIVAHRIDTRGPKHRRGLSAGQGRAGLSEPGRAGGHPADAAGPRSQESGQAGQRELQTKNGAGLHGRPEFAGRHASDAESAERAIARPARAGRPGPANRRSWHTPWQEVAYETCRVPTRAGNDRVDDGSPARVYGPEGISEAAHRRERLKACGNAIVPQVAVEIMKAIKATE